MDKSIHKITCFLLVCILQTKYSFADCPNEEQLQTQIQQLKDEKEKLQLKLDEESKSHSGEEKQLNDDLAKKLANDIENYKREHLLEAKELKDKLADAQNSVRQYTQKVGQQERQLSSLVMQAEIAKQERAKLEEFAAAEILKFQKQLEGCSSAECPIIPKQVTDFYDTKLHPYMNVVASHEYVQKASKMYKEHLHPVVQPIASRGYVITGQVKDKIVNDYVPIAVNYSTWAGQKSYELGVTVANLPEAQRAKQAAIDADQELQKYILQQMKNIEQVKAYANPQMALLVVYSIYSAIVGMFVLVSMLLCCRSKKQTQLTKDKKHKSQPTKKSTPKDSTSDQDQLSSTATSQPQKKKKGSNGVKKQPGKK